MLLLKQVLGDITMQRKLHEMLETSVKSVQKTRARPPTRNSWTPWRSSARRRPRLNRYDAAFEQWWAGPHCINEPAMLRFACRLSRYGCREPHRARTWMLSPRSGRRLSAVTRSLSSKQKRRGHRGGGAVYGTPPETLARLGGRDRDPPSVRTGQETDWLITVVQPKGRQIL